MSAVFSVTEEPRRTGRGHDEAGGGRRAGPGHPGCTHWVAEEGPEVTLAALTAFLAPYQKNRDSTPAARRRNQPDRRELAGFTTNPPGDN